MSRHYGRFERTSMDAQTLLAADPEVVEAIERMRADAAVSHGPCVKHRCFCCHRIFDSLMHGTDCPHCSGSSICSCENREECQ
jgi:hypothetical protein